MSLVDIVIVLVVIGAIFRGFDEGLVHQLFSSAGFFAGLLLGALVLEPRLIGLAHTSAARLAITLSSTLGVALVSLFGGELLGILLKKKLRPQEFLNEADSVLGAAIACGAILATVWLGAGVAASLPYPVVQEQV